MTTRRSRGDIGLYWSEAHQRWVAEATIDYTPAGKRITKKASGARTRPKSKTSSRRLLGCLNRSVIRAVVWDKVKRNVVALCGIPKGHVVLSLLTGARTEELRALDWNHVDLEGNPKIEPPVPPSIQVGHSVRVGGDTKTKKSRRTLSLPLRCVKALRAHREELKRIQTRAGTAWRDDGLVFATSTGTALAAGNVRRAFRLVAAKAGLESTEWTPRELRHSFVSLLSSNGVSIEDIAELSHPRSLTSPRSQGSLTRPTRTGSHALSHPAERRGHNHRWIMAPDLVDRTYQNKNHVFPVQGREVMVAAVRRRNAVVQ
jgi:integrase